MSDVAPGAGDQSPAFEMAQVSVPIRLDLSGTAEDIKALGDKIKEAVADAIKDAMQAARSQERPQVAPGYRLAREAEQGSVARVSREDNTSELLAAVTRIAEELRRIGEVVVEIREGMGSLGNGIG